MPEHVNAAIVRILADSPDVHVVFTNAVAPDSYWLHTRSLYVHTCHRDAVAALRAR